MSIKFHPGNSLVVQWLRVHASNAKNSGLIPGRGARVTHAAQTRKYFKSKFYRFYSATMQISHNYMYTSPPSMYPLLLRGFPGGSGGKKSACNAGDPGSVPGWGRSPGGGNGTPLQYCLENPMDRGTWEATVPGVTKHRARLRTSTFTFSSSLGLPPPPHLTPLGCHGKLFFFFF